VNRRQSIVEPARPASVASLGTSRLAGSRFPRSRGICGDEPGESGGPGLRWKPGWGRLQAGPPAWPGAPFLIQMPAYPQCAVNAKSWFEHCRA